MEEDQRLLERILDGAENPRDLPFELLKDITDGFSKERKIGQGGFGEVYKGVLGERIVAVKRIHINQTTIDDKLFRREVASLMSINHRNVVQFLGVCSGGYQKPIDKDGSGELVWANVLERLLCFRYISNGSLERHITDELRGLEWEARYEIITGICKGLLYLHKEKDIIHMDLKPANILLDHQDGKYMVPKITDFGLSRSNKNSHTMGERFGTLEYMAPEYREESKTTQSCDIYSLGLIIIELVTGCKDVPNKDNVLRRWRHRWQKPPTQLQYQQVTRCIDIAGQCRRKNPKDRPSIWKIINFLSLSESTYWQISPFLDEDDMLRINPLEVRLPFELKNEISCTIELTNETRNCIFAFNIQIPSTMYNAQPDKGIVRPESKYSVKITVKARDVDERDLADKFIVQSMKGEASEGLGDEDIIERMFEKAGRFTDEVDLMVVYESMKPQENFKRSEDTNVPAEEVPETKNCEYSSGTSGKEEAASMSMKVEESEGLGDEDIIVRRFEKMGRFIDEVDLMIEHEFPKPQENFKPSEVSESLPTLTKSGPRGGRGGSIRDIEQKPWRLASLTIIYGGIISSFSFSYIDQARKKQHVGPWGTDYRNEKTETISFGLSEFVEEVSGVYGSYRGIIRVISLMCVTNVRTYGPFGNPYHKNLEVLTHFRFMADKGSSIVGFHGRSGSYMDAIGVYMYPDNRTTIGAISVPSTLDGQSLPIPTKCGAWGGSGGDAKDISEKPWRLTSLTVSYKGLIDAFSFSYIDQAGKKQSVGPWGEGYHNDKIETIRFGPSEFVQEVCGAYGDHHGVVIVKFLSFVTNVGTYGPFGTPDHPGPGVSATHFRFLADKGSSIVGFYGRSGRYINGFGVYTVRVTES